MPSGVTNATSPPAAQLGAAKRKNSTSALHTMLRHMLGSVDPHATLARCMSGSTYYRSTSQPSGCLLVDADPLAEDAREDDRVASPVPIVEERAQKPLAREAGGSEEADRRFVVGIDPRLDARHAEVGERPVRRQPRGPGAIAAASGARNDPIAKADNAGLRAHAEPHQPDRAPLGVDRERHALAVDEPLPLTTDERSARGRGEHGRNGGARRNPRVGPRLLDAGKIVLGPAAERHDAVAQLGRRIMQRFTGHRQELRV